MMLRNWRQLTGLVYRLPEGPYLANRRTKECLERMNEWCQNHHTGTKACLISLDILRGNNHRLRPLYRSLSTATSTITHPRFQDFHPKFPNHSSDRFFSKSSGADCRTCWNCNSDPTSELFLVCDSCGCIQPLNRSLDYFHLFGFEKKFDLEEGTLEKKYKDWQKKLHPDLVHSKSEREREYAADQSSHVIEAYKTLGDSLSRAIYLMKLHGVHVDEEQTVSDPELLAEIMELRESVEDAGSSQELEQIQTKVHTKIKEWIESFARAYASQDIEHALSAIRRITYYKRAREEIVKRL